MSKMTFEQRTVTEGVELRSAADGKGPGTLVAYAAVFGAESGDLGGFTERVMPGAFGKTLSEADVRAVVNHDPSQLLGRNRAGTLRMVEDGHGLRYEVDLPDTTAGRDLATSVERGDITGSSFKFRAIQQDWDTDEGRALPLRSLTEVALADVGPVTFPAYSATDGKLALRSLAEHEDLDEEALLAAASAGDLRALISADHEGVEEPDTDDAAEAASGVGHSFRPARGRFIQ